MPRQISEERTRKEMIDPQLDQVGWVLRDHSKVKTDKTRTTMALIDVFMRANQARWILFVADRVTCKL